MAVMHTTMMSANITAYSTAVGPSSRFRKSTADDAMRENITKLHGERLNNESGIIVFSAKTGFSSVLGEVALGEGEAGSLF
jgi:hypothetical protein